MNGNIWMLQYFDLQVMATKIRAIAEWAVRNRWSLFAIEYIYKSQKSTWIRILKNKMEKFVISHTAFDTQNQIIKSEWHLVTLCACAFVWPRCVNVCAYSYMYITLHIVATYGNGLTTPFQLFRFSCHTYDIEKQFSIVFFFQSPTRRPIHFHL